MTIKLPMDSADEAEWPSAYAWFGEKLTLLYKSIVPRLRDEMADEIPA